MMALPPTPIMTSPAYSPAQCSPSLSSTSSFCSASPTSALWTPSPSDGMQRPCPQYPPSCKSSAFVWDSPDVWNRPMDSCGPRQLANSPSLQTGYRLLAEDDNSVDQPVLTTHPDYNWARLSHLGPSAVTAQTQQVPDTAAGCESFCMAPWSGVATSSAASVKRSSPLPTSEGAHVMASSVSDAEMFSLSGRTLSNSLNSGHFVPYTLGRIRQFQGNVSPLQQNRQRTQPLRDWLCANRLNPYPNKADRDMLSLQTGLSPDQVAMWFANTRRRIKKIGMHSWSDGRYSDEEFHAKSLHSVSSD